MHLVEGSVTKSPLPATKNNGISRRAEKQHIQGLITDLCRTLTTSSPHRGSIDHIPLKQLKERAFATLLKQKTSSVVSSIPEPERVTSCLRTWSVEEVLLAKAFEWHLYGRKQGADRLRRCLTELRLGTEGVRAFLHFLLLLSKDSAEDAGSSALPFTHRRTSPGPYQEAAPRGDGSWFTEYPSELFEGTRRESSSYGDTLAFPHLFEAVPGFDSNGNPLFALSNKVEARSDNLSSWGSQVLHPPKVAPLNKLSLIQMTKRFGLPERAPSSASCEKPRRLPCIGKSFGGERTDARPRSRELPGLLLRRSGSKVAREGCGLLLQPPAVQMRVLLQHVLYLLAGVPSDSFLWDQGRRRFVARRGLRTDSISEQALENALANFLQCGTDVHSLEEWSARTDSGRDGLLLEAFRCGLRRYMHSYQGSLLCITHNLENMTLLSIDCLTAKVREQVTLTARFCREELKASHSGIGVRGTDLLGRLYRAALNGWCQNHYGVLLLLLHYTSQPYCRFLQEWLFNGYYDDPFEDFPVRLDRRLTDLHDETFWLRGFELRKSHDGSIALPFFSHLADKVLLCAKTVTLLMLCLPHKVELWDDNSLPPLALTFSRESLRRIKEASERYFDTKRKNLGLELWIKDQRVAAPLDGPQRESTSKAHGSSTTRTHAVVREQKESSRQSSSASSQDEEPKEDTPSTKKPEQTAEASVTSPCKAVSETPSDEVGSYCEGSQAYGTPMNPHPRNPHGHSSDSQMRNILYPGLEQEGSCSTAKGTGTAAAEVGRRPQQWIDAETGENVSSSQRAGIVGSEEDVEEARHICDSAGGLNCVKDLEDVTCSDSAENFEFYSCSGNESTSQRVDNTEGLATQKNEPAIKADHFESASSGDAGKECATLSAMSAANEDEEIGGREQVQNTVLLGSRIQSGQTSDSDSWLQHLECSRVEPLAPLGSLEQPDVSWKEYLISAYCTHLPNSRDGEQLLPIPPDELEEFKGRGPSISLQHAMEASLLPPLLAQMRLVNGAAVAYFMRDLELSSHLQVLGDFFCLQDGDFAVTLCWAICEKASTCQVPLDLLHPSVLCQILSQALASSLWTDSPQAARLTLDARSIPESSLSDENVLSYLFLNYKVEWPLNLVITTSSLQRYNKLFHFLLQLHRAQWALADVWLYIQSSATRGCLSAQMKHLQKIKHEMEHFVQLLQSCIASEAVGATLRELQDQLSNKVHTLDDLRQAHATCVTHLARRCLLVKQAAPVAKILHRALKSIMHFRTCVLNQPWVSAAQSGKSAAFGQVLAVHARFQEETTALCKVLRAWGMSVSLTWCTRFAMALASRSTKKKSDSAHQSHPAFCRTALSK